MSPLMSINWTQISVNRYSNPLVFKNFLSALPSHILTLLSFNIRLSVEPFINHNNSRKQLLHASFFVDKNGTLLSSDKTHFIPKRT